MFLFITHFGFHWMNLSGQPQPPSLGITNPTYLHTNMPNYFFTSHPSPPFFFFNTSCWCKGLSCLWQPLWLLYSFFTTTWNWTLCTIFGVFFLLLFPLPCGGNLNGHHPFHFFSLDYFPFSFPPFPHGGE